MEGADSVLRKQADNDGAETGESHGIEAEFTGAGAAEFVIDEPRTGDHENAEDDERGVHPAAERRADVTAAVGSAGGIAEVADSIEAQAERGLPGICSHPLGDEVLQ